MNRKYALLISILITSLLAVNFQIFSLLDEPSLESVVVSKVIDGDTLKLDDGRTVRLANINTPEKSDINSADAVSFLKEYENLSIQIDVLGVDRYGRVLARAYSQSYLNLEVVSEGLGNKFLVNEEELKIFSQAEEEAILNEKGIWKKSSFYGCIDADIKEEDEFIILESKCGIVNFNGWKIKDESRKYLFLGNVSAEVLIIHTENGINNSTDIYWNSKSHVWNNDRDTLYLFDSKNNIVYHYSYGY